MRRLAPHALLLAALAAAAWLAWRWTLGLPLLGWDAFPLVAASRVGAAGDLARVLGDELMGGRYPDGSFYRPLTQLTFTLDHALSGVAPAAYRVTDLLATLACAWLLALVTRRLAGGWIGPLAAGLALLLHPVQLEVLPFTPRRADTLALAFVLAALLAQRRERTTWAATAAAALLAATSKETGALALPLVFLWQACVVQEGAPAARVSAALRRSAPAALALAACVAARTAVLGGLGGHAESGAAGLGDAPRLFAECLSVALDVPRGGLLAVAALPFAAALGLLAVRRERGGTPDLGAALLVAGWLDGALLLTLLAGRAHGWYALWFVAPLALLLGLTLERARRLALERRFSGLEVAGAAALAVLVLAARHGGARAPDPAFEAARELTAAQLATFERAVDGTPTGETARIEGWAVAVPREGGFVFLQAPYSMAAYAELVRPKLDVRVSAEDGALVVSR